MQTNLTPIARLCATIALLTLLSPIAVNAGELASTNSGFRAAVDESALADARGGTESLSKMDLDGVVSNNEAYNLNTGNNTISDGSLQGASGIPMVIQNSGNNVLIQNATIVNVQMQ